jgi:hypothetical protein
LRSPDIPSQAVHHFSSFFRVRLYVKVFITVCTLRKGPCGELVQ